MWRNFSAKFVIFRKALLRMRGYYYETLEGIYLCMGCLSRTNLIMIRSFLKFLISPDFACCQNGGTGQTILHYSGSAMWRLDSSLRSHRAWRSQCRHAYSGLNKTLFASVGPNSHGRGHLRSTILGVINDLHAKKDISSLGRMNPSRGHRLDGTFISRSFSWVSAKLTNAANIPPYIRFVVSRCLVSLTSIFCLFGLHPKRGRSGEKCGRSIAALKRDFRSYRLLLLSFSGFCFVRIFKMIGRFSTFVKTAVSHHGVYNSQQSSANGNVGLGLSDPFDKSLSDSFLSGIGFAKGDASLAECPSERGRTGFCDLSGLRSSGGFFVVRSDSCPELQSIGVGESVKRSDLCGNDACPDICDTWYAFEDSCHSGEFFTSIRLDDFSSERFSLTLNEGNDINEVRESFPLDIFEQMPVGQEPLLSGGSLEFRSADISGMENRLHTVFGFAERFTELLPVPAKLSQLHQWFVSDVSQRAVSFDKSDGNIERIVSVVFPAFTSSVSQFGSIGDVNPFDAIPISVDEPFDERDGFDRHPSWFGQRVEPVFDLVDAFGVDGQGTDDAFVGVHGSKRNGGFVQVDADERGEVGIGYVPAFSDTFVLFCLSFFHDRFLKKGFVK